MTTSTRRTAARKLAGAVLAGGLIGAPVLGFGPFVAVGQAEEQPRAAGSPAGRALATGVFATYSDQENFFPGAATVPPSTWSPLAVGGFENNGVGFARAAFGYNPYEDAPGSVNALTPAGAPQLPFDELRKRAQASVQGEAPQSQESSVAPEAGLPGGTVRAGLEEEGPAAFSEVVGTKVAPAAEVLVDSVTSRIRVSKAGGQAVSSASTLLEHVTVAGVLTFESIRVEASSTADGGPGQSTATVQLNGVAVNGTPVVITDQGVVASDTSVPLGTGPINEALTQAGLELLAPGGSSMEPTGTNSVAEARGPSFRLSTSDRREVELVLGLASTASVLFDVNQEPSASLAPAPAESGGDRSEPETASAGPVVAAEPPAFMPSGSADPRPSARSSAAPATTSMPLDLWNTPPAPPGEEPAGPAAAASPSLDETAAAPPAVVGPGRAAALGLVSAAATGRVNALYAILAVASGALLLLALGVPSGARWAEDA